MDTLQSNEKAAPNYYYADTKYELGFSDDTPVG
jgi:hypothetical protein